MRCVLRNVLLVSIVWCGAASVAEARDELLMPFDCDLEEGRIKLSPAAERSYPIIDGREAQTVAVCNPRVSAECRTITAHRFDIACGGTRLAWMRVAAAIRRAGSTPAWIKDGRLNVVLPVRHASDKPSCMERPDILARPHQQGGPLRAQLPAGVSRQLRSRCAAAAALRRSASSAPGSRSPLRQTAPRPQGGNWPRTRSARRLSSPGATRTPSSTPSPASPTPMTRASARTSGSPWCGPKRRPASARAIARRIRRRSGRGSPLRCCLPVPRVSCASACSTRGPKSCASRRRAGRACSDSAPCACGGTAATPSRRAGSPTPVAR